jgi:hypothetical protein
MTIRLRLDVWGRRKGKFYDPSRSFVVRPLFYKTRFDCFERQAPHELLDRGDSRPCVVDILTRHASAHFPLLPPRLGLASPPSFSSHAWPTPSAFSSMTPPPTSPTSLLPTHSQYPTFSRAGTHASPSPLARHSPVSWETVAVFMSHPRMVLHFPFSGRVRHHATFFFSFARLHLCPCRKRHSIIRYRRRAHHIRPSARRPYKFLHLAFHDGWNLFGGV